MRDGRREVPVLEGERVWLRPLRPADRGERRALGFVEFDREPLEIGGEQHEDVLMGASSTRG